MSDIRFNSWFHRSGTGGVFQDGSGRVGIGSTQPVSHLDLNGGTLTGNVTGNTSGTAGGLSGTPDITVNNVTSGIVTASNRIQVGTASTIIGVGQTTLIGHESQQLTTFNDPNATTLALVDKNNNVQLQLRGTSPIVFFDQTSGGNGRVFTDTADFKINTGRPSSFDAANDKVTIDSSGKVGIGTDNPSATLVVGGISQPTTSRGAVAIKAQATDTALSFANMYLEEPDGGEGYYLSVNSDGDLNFVNSGTSTVLTLADDNNVGIGTDNPSQNLSLYDSGFCGLKIQSGRSGDNQNIGGLAFYDHIGAGTTAYVYGKTGGRIDFGTTGSTRMTLRETGNLELANGNLVFSTSGTGIDFSATGNSSGTMTSELLDDYEEGTFTPSYINGFAPGGYSSQTGRYTKIGNLVYFQLQLIANSGSVFASHLRIGGLPFNAASASPPYGGAYFVYQTIANTTSQIPMCLIVNGTDDIYLYKVDGNFWNANDGVGTVVNKEVRINGFYTV